MSTKRNAASRRKQVRAKQARENAAGEVVWSDHALGITLRKIRPGGSSEREQLRWTLPSRDDPGVALLGLAGLVRVGRLLDEIEDMLVDEGRDDGLSWDSLGRAVGVSGERVRQRHGERRRSIESAPGWGSDE